MDEIATRILNDHLSVNEVKPISYLPARTIINVLNMSLHEYMQMARENGLCSIAFSGSESCIDSGAVYVYHQQYLNALLSRHREMLCRSGWPSETADFIRQIASDWLDEGHPVLPVVRHAFGDADADR